MKRLASKAPAAVLFVLLLLPLVALAASTSVADLVAAARHPLFRPALWLSLRTSILSQLLAVVAGTPLAWWLAQTTGRLQRVSTTLLHLPIVMPPAVLGVALLQAFGRSSLLGGLLDRVGLGIPFTGAAVVLAQVVVSAPLYVLAASTALRSIDRDLVTVARTLGASPASAFFHVALPLALPGLLSGASLAWARALGEFGATLLFAGNLTGTTQTLPLAIFTALESDVRIAVAVALLLAALAALSLFAVRALPEALQRRRQLGGEIADGAI
jgi:molybdate transport system permease protein